MRTAASALEERLRRHVQALAGEIGVRHVWRPQALRAAAGYIRAQFEGAGYPGVMVTDTAFYRNPHYHSASDTPGRLRYPEMARVVEGLALALGALAEARPSATR